MTFYYRKRTFNVTLTEEELGMLHALAEDNGEPMCRMMRRWIRDQYRVTFGQKKPKPAFTQKDQRELNRLLAKMKPTAGR